MTMREQMNLQTADTCDPHRAGRKSTCLSAFIIKGSCVAKGIILNVSPEGAAIVSKEILPEIGETIYVQFRLHAFTDLICLKAKVAWSTLANDENYGPLGRIGVEWVVDEANLDPRRLGCFDFPFANN